MLLRVFAFVRCCGKGKIYKLLPAVELYREENSVKEKENDRVGAVEHLAVGFHPVVCEPGGSAGSALIGLSSARIDHVLGCVSTVCGQSNQNVNKLLKKGYINVD